MHMDPIFASLWFAFVAGFGIAVLLDAWSAHLKRMGRDSAASFLFVVSRAWGLIPVLYAMPDLLSENGILGIFAVVPGWSLGMEEIAQDIFGFSFSEILGLQQSGSGSILGLAEIGWIALGMVLLGVAAGISRMVKGD